MRDTVTMRREERQGEILDAALRVIRRDGVDGLRAQSLADEAGVSIAAPYHYFTSLQDIICAVYVRERGIAQVRRDVAQAAAGTLPADQLRAILAADFEGPPETVSTAWGTRIEYQRRAIFDERVRELVYAGEHHALEQLTTTLQSEQTTTGSPPETISTELAARRLLALSCGLGVLVVLAIIAPSEAVTLLDGALHDRPHWQQTGTGHGESAPARSFPTAPAGDQATHILDATVALIARSGVAGVRFPAVAHEAGVSPSLPRYYFRTKRALLDAAFAHDMALAQQRMARSADELADPLARLQYAYIGSSPEHLAALRPTLVLWSEYLRVAEREPAAQTTARERLQFWIDTGLRLGTELADAGHTQPNRITLAASQRQLAVNTGAAVLWLIGVLTAGEYPVVVNGTIDDELGLSA